ncbi:BTAD domain-containing putative transcriptional regulator [Dactylosporangium sp. NPDC049140]|uniref:AfsR/SARP family transcriptional regulator n=1 Tax=Dactylosporangium sp. NPDC049140 TaxID=3155647 RepID=UPI0033ED9C6C
MRFDLLGPMEIVTDGGGVAELAGRKRRVLAAVLAAQANRPVSVDVLAEALWGGAATRQAEASLRVHVHHLRRALGGERIARRPEGYVLTLRPDELDLERFRARLAEGDDARLADDRERAALAFARALALWRGPALAGFGDVPVLAAEIARLEELRLQALERRFEAELALGRADGIVAELRALTGRHPLRETFRGQLMRALIGTGRGAEAIAVFEETRRLLAGELGLDPSPPLRDLHLSVLRDEPLAPPAATTEPPPARAAAPSPARAAGPADADPAVPRQLPPATAGFTGRSAWLGRLDALVPSGDGAAMPIAAISGGGGIGKTTLAVHWAHRVRERFPDGQLYANLRGFDPVAPPAGPFDVLREFLDALGLPPERIPPGAEARMNAYRTLLAERRVLVVLDNARDAEQVRPLLPGASGGCVLVTSRNRLAGLVAADGARPMPLELFSAGEARELLARRAGAGRADAEPDAAARILERCAGLPLALSIVAARLAVNPGLSLAAVADELERTEHRLDPFAGDDASTDVRAVFSWSYRILGPDAARLFRLLGVLEPGADIGLAAAAALAGRSAAQTRPLLAQLVQGHLLIEPTPGRYVFHDLLHAYAAELGQVTDTVQERDAALRRLLDHYLSTAHAAAVAIGTQLSDLVTTPTTRPGPSAVTFSGSEAALAWLAAERSALAAAAVQAVAAFPAHAWQLARVLQAFLVGQGHFHDQLRLQQAALEAANRDRNPAARAAAHRGLAYARLIRGEHDRSEDHLRRALHLFRGLGDTVHEGYCLHNLSLIHGSQGRTEETIALLREALELFRRTGETRGQTITLNGLAYGHMVLGDYGQALDFGHQALELHRRTGNWQRGSAIVANLAEIHGCLGQWDIAQDYLRGGIELCLKAGNLHHAAALLANLGDAHEAAGEPGPAEEAWRRARQIAETLDYGPERQSASDPITGLRWDRFAQNTDSMGPRRK